MEAGPGLQARGCHPPRPTAHGVPGWFQEFGEQDRGWGTWGGCQDRGPRLPSPALATALLSHVGPSPVPKASSPDPKRMIQFSLLFL